MMSLEDDVRETWLSDVESVIHQHCGSDGSSDEHNDWVNDLANELWRTCGFDLGVNGQRRPHEVPLHSKLQQVWVYDGRDEDVFFFGPNGKQVACTSRLNAEAAGLVEPLSLVERLRNLVELLDANYVTSLYDDLELLREVVDALEMVDG